MSLALIPNFSVPMVRHDEDRVPFHADPILAAIDAHQEAWNVFQVAPTGDATERAETFLNETLDVLLGTPCASRFGGFALLRHLRWWLAEEAENADAYAISYPIAQAREQDLTLLLGSDGVSRIPQATPLGRLPGPARDPAPKRIVIEASPVPTPGLVRLSRAVSSLGEILSGFVLIGGGCLLIGICTRLS